MLRYVSVGTEFIVTFGILLAGGIWADMRLDTLPGFALLGAAVGFALGLYRLVKQAREIQRLDRKRQDAGEDRT